MSNYLFLWSNSSEAVAVLQKIYGQKKCLLLRSNYYKEVAAPDNQVFWKNAFSQKSSCFKEATALKV